MLPGFWDRECSEIIVKTAAQLTLRAEQMRPFFWRPRFFPLGVANQVGWVCMCGIPNHEAISFLSHFLPKK